MASNNNNNNNNNAGPTVNTDRPCTMHYANVLRNLLNEPGIQLMPGVYDCLSAKVCASKGFKVLYTSGLSISGTLLGMPDIGLLCSDENVRHVANIVNSVQLPIIADCDTGYGGTPNVFRLVKQMIQIGVAGLTLEDQEWPKRCGHFEGKKVIPMEEHVLKIRAAAAARGNSGIVIIGRTDARQSLGIDEAIRRAKAYAAAGADIVFVEAPQSEEELKLIMSSITEVPVLVNFIEGGRTPMKYSVDNLEKMGFKLAMYSTAAVLAVQRALEDVYGTIKEHGHTEPMRSRMSTFLEYRALVDEDSWQEDYFLLHNEPPVLPMIDTPKQSRVFRRTTSSSGKTDSSPDSSAHDLALLGLSDQKAPQSA